MKQHNKIKAVVLGICLAACSGLAGAQTQTIDRGIYIGTSLGQSEAKKYDCTAMPQCENHGSVGKLFLGLQFGRHWSFELALADLGKVDSANPGTFQETVEVRLAEATILASYPFNGKFMVYAKGGAYYAQTTDSFTQNGVSTRLQESNAAPTWGFGAQWFVWRGLAVRGEAQRYMKVGGGNIGDSDYNVYTIGVLYKMK